MRRGSIILVAVIALFLIFGMNACSSYNTMVEKNEAVTGQWQQVENQYQRRSDLIPSLVATVKGEANFERSTLEAVINARANATKVTISPEKLDEASLQKFQQVQGELSSALSRLLVVSEQYPNLKSNAAFSELRTQLEGTENRIANERMKFNQTAQEFNVFIKRFPKNIYAGMFGFEKRAYFESKEGSENAPVVNFDDMKSK